MSCENMVSYRFCPIRQMWQIRDSSSDWVDFAVGFLSEEEFKDLLVEELSGDVDDIQM